MYRPSGKSPLKPPSSVPYSSRRSVKASRNSIIPCAGIAICVLGPPRVIVCDTCATNRIVLTNISLQIFFGIEAGARWKRFVRTNHFFFFDTFLRSFHFLNAFYHLKRLTLSPQDDIHKGQTLSLSLPYHLV